MKNFSLKLLLDNKKVLNIYISNLEHGAGGEERMPVWVVWT